MVNDYNHPWTLVERCWDNRESGYWRYRFEGYGTHYDGVVDTANDPRGDFSVFKSAGGKDVLIDHIERLGGQTVIVSNVSATEFLEEVGENVR